MIKVWLSNSPTMFIIYTALYFQ